MRSVIQPYESHMQYLAQWMCDYNLFGCAYLECSTVTFRGPVPNYLEMDSALHHWHDRTIPAEYISDPAIFPKQSHCSIEVDIQVQNIVNRHEIEARSIHHDFIERINPLSPEEKLVHSMAGLWKDETRRRKARLGITDPGSSPFPPEVLISMSADPRNSQPGGWIHEEEYREKLTSIKAAEADKSDKGKVTFDTFVRPTPSEHLVKTALESVEDLYPENLPALDMSLDAEQSRAKDGSVKGLEDVLVDERRILALDDDDFVDDPEFPVPQQVAMHEQGKLTRTGTEEVVSNELQPEASNLRAYNGGTSTTTHYSISSPESRGPTSSSELEALGVRKIEDIDQAEKDAFHIPDEFISHVQPSRNGHKRNNLMLEFPLPRKRQKVLQDEAPFDTFLAPHGGTAAVPLQEPQSAPLANTVAEPIAIDLLKKSEPKANSIANKSDTLSPNGLKPIGALRNTGLPFPIVKDPNNPNTLLRLSQHSASSQKTKDSSPGKQLEFHTSREPATSQSLTPSSIPGSSQRSPRPWAGNAQILANNTRLLFRTKSDTELVCLVAPPPSTDVVSATMAQEGLPKVIYQDAFYSDDRDVPERQREYAGREFKIESDTVPYLPDFDATGLSMATYGRKLPILLDPALGEKQDRARRKACKLKKWSIACNPPSHAEVVAWLEAESERTRVAHLTLEDMGIAKPSAPFSQIEGPTQKNKYGFKYSQKQESTSVQHETQYMSVMSLEVHVNTRGKLAPNPEEDEIACVVWCVQSDDEDLECNGTNEGTHVGILALSECPGMAKKISRCVAVEVEEESTELDLLTRMVDIVRRYDPDIMTGYEVHNSSWGYMIERARYKYDYDLCDEFSRMKSLSHGRFGKENDRWGFNHTSTIRVTGRHMINIWRAMRGELNLLQYTMENVVFHVLQRRIPHVSFAVLTAWYRSGKPRDLAKMLDYFVSRVQIDLEILDSNELVPRTSEQARLLGVDFFSVFSRGSQFKVESLMFRIAKPENFILISPSRKQVGGQNALECLPLVMEPQSNFYPSPLLVLDFQSLYPSVMIAYNYCYSTFLGRVVNWRGQNKMGFTDFHREPGLLELFGKDQVNIAPNGIMYVKPEIRKSLLAKMLSEILETRVMVKSGMKVDKDDKTLQRLLNNRQLALKLIANVTYGYTSASFSGRMPCSEIADSIVQTGRETLEKAIALIHSVGKWGAEVVYGDTDSLFVYLKGRTRDEAFDIGEEIAKAVTDINPRPVKLKFEKVYHPCVLLAKKRYVGFKYENRHQKEPDFDAKGIETVRRDGTPAEQKIEEKALKILFKTADLSQVKNYFQHQCSKIMQGKVSVQDFCFAKEVKLGTYSDKGPPPPGALISARRMLEDPRLEPQYGERVPYVVITGGPGARLLDRCVAPDVLLNDPQTELDAEYYISKNLIPPLERIFNLVGANVRQWYDEMPKHQRIRRVEAQAITDGKVASLFSKKTLESYMKSSACVVCRDKLDSELPLCNACLSKPSVSLLTLRSKLMKAEKKAADMGKICRSCMSLPFGEEIRCDSKDCPVFYSRTRHMTNFSNSRAQIEPVIDLLEEQHGNGLEW